MGHAAAEPAHGDKGSGFGTAVAAPRSRGCPAWLRELATHECRTPGSQGMKSGRTVPGATNASVLRRGSRSVASR
jgi:hypothetical protein